MDLEFTHAGGTKGQRLLGEPERGLSTQNRWFNRWNEQSLASLALSPTQKANHVFSKIHSDEDVEVGHLFPLPTVSRGS